MKRPTITDIAREAGVSKGAVSYALNGRPGVSEATRQRITEIARELGWAPSSTARALSGGRAGAIGLVLDRPPDVLGAEPFLTALLEGLGPASLLLQVVPDLDAELAVHRRWRGERKVDGVLLAGPGCAAELPGIGLPAVVLGGPLDHPGVPSVWVDDGVAAAEMLEYLAALGHRRVVRIAGQAAFAHPRARAEAFTAAAGRLGLSAGTVHTGRTAEAGPGVTQRVLTGPRPPTALVCDTDVLAVAALAAARELGLAVPGDVSVVSWEDSPLCRLVRPALSAVRRPLAELGSLAAAMVRDLVAGEEVTDVCASRPRLVTRGSTGPARS
ncbi:LacI family DNA-binding transcriptional regulator [Amycolatopsis sp. NEAU-NG30]|uniref:LacI family DNA-binding transcriptional regulator n=1 Tax=Amycolatopsis melonis TaxID=3156488 RepID=A0ABV0LP41_9PSEU